MGLEQLGGLALLAAGALLGSLVTAAVATFWPASEPPGAPAPPGDPSTGSGQAPGAPREKPKHVHIWHRRSTEQTNQATRHVYGCYECPALEVRELEAVGEQ